MAEEAHFLIADLSGYTAYLAASEPEHAPVIAGDFLSAVVARLRPLFRLEKLEGDGAFLHAPIDRLDGRLLLDTLESAYVTFQHRLLSLRQATTCDCTSCKRMPDLDLKFVIHSGGYIRQRIAGREEMTGTDVIVVHRLLKSETPSRLGLSRYVLLTDAAVARLGLEPLALDLAEAVENIDHVGEVRVHILDLATRWSDERRRPRVVVSRQRALAEVEVQLPAAPPVVWEYLTAPRWRQLWEAAEPLTPFTAEADRGVACVTGRLATLETILDWRPFESFAAQIRLAGGGALVASGELEPADGATRVRLRWAAPRSARRRGELATAASELAAERRSGLQRLAQLLPRGVEEAAS
jgi:hypothetical protein